MERDLAQPPGSGGRIAKLVQLLMGREKRLLGQVFGVRSVPHQSVAVPEDQSMVGIDQLFDVDRRIGR